MSRTTSGAEKKAVISADFMGKRRSREQLSKLLHKVDSEATDDLPSDKPWRDAVLAYLEANEITQETLGQWVGTSQSVVSNVLSEANKQFTPRHPFVRRIGAATGIGLPVTARIELAAKAAIEAGHLEVAQAAALNMEAMLEHLRRNKP
jgi:hypothetical protein